MFRIVREIKKIYLFTFNKCRIYNERKNRNLTNHLIFFHQNFQFLFRLGYKNFILRFKISESLSSLIDFQFNGVFEIHSHPV